MAITLTPRQAIAYAYARREAINILRDMALDLSDRAEAQAYLVKTIHHRMQRNIGLLQSGMRIPASSLRRLANLKSALHALDLGQDRARLARQMIENLLNAHKEDPQDMLFARYNGYLSILEKFNKGWLPPVRRDNTFAKN